GANYQMGKFVLGVETVIQATGQKFSTTSSGGGLTVSESHKIPWFGTTRLRFGVAADQFLIYGTGGVGYGEMRNNYTFSGTVVGSSDSWRVRPAWVVGGGVEGFINRNLTWRLEYLYMDTGTFSDSFFGLPISVKVTDNVFRFGMNYLFR